MQDHDQFRRCRCGGQAVRVRLQKKHGLIDDAKLARKLVKMVAENAYWATIGFAALIAGEETGVYKIFVCKRCSHPEVHLL